MDELIQSDVRRAELALDDLLTRRAELRRECERAVVQWRWAREGSDLQRPEPLYRERYGLPAARLLEQPPPVPQDEQQYGVDAAGDILVVREYVSRNCFREELRVQRGDTVVGYRWSESGQPFEANIARFVAGRIRSYVVRSPRVDEDSLHGLSIQRFEYDGDVVCEIHEDADLALGDEPLPGGPTRIRASYDPLGGLLELREHSDRGEKVLYRAQGSGPSMDALQRRVEDRLVYAVPKLVHEQAGDEEIYCVVLHYHRDWPLPPTVGIGLARDRRAWIDSIDDVETLRLTVWNPAEFSNYRGATINVDLNDLDPALARALRAIPEHAEGAADRGRSTLNRAAARLQQLDWRSIASVTDDFVVFAVDFELTQLEQNLRYSVPAAIRESLAGRDLL